MNTIVILHEPMDLGVGAHTDIEFFDCTYHADDVGGLHIRHAEAGNVASYARGTWHSVYRGNVTSRPVSEGADLDRTELMVVQGGRS